MLTSNPPKQKERIEKALAVLGDAIRQFNPQWVFALFSGGHDSLTSSYIASLHSKFNGCVHINTGIGIPATRQFVIDTCSERGWPLKEYKAIENTYADGSPNPMDYEAIVLREGFPGPSGHSIMYRRLKQYQLERVRRDYGRVLFISGERAQESARRKRHTAIPTSTRGRMSFVTPIRDWSKSECSDALTQAGFKRNKVVLDLGRSGECLCGAYAEEGELAVVEFACPATAERIRNLEQRVREAGHPWGWEQSVPKWWTEKKRGQTFMLGYDTEEHLCTSCKWRAA